MANLLLFLLPAILGLLLPQPAAAIDHGPNYLLTGQTLLLPQPAAAIDHGPNYLLTGQTLQRENSLSLVQQDYRLTMQGDCNLVLSNLNGSTVFWHTNITGLNGCSLHLNDYGKLFILHPTSGNIPWFSDPFGNKSGQYAAVLHPEGKLVVYGLVLWSTTPSPLPSSEGFGQPPRVSNMLFSDRAVLYDGDKVKANEDIYLILDDCNLKLRDGDNITWQSDTAGKGEYCHVRLTHHGVLHILDDDDVKIWSSDANSTSGEYVLIINIKPGRGTVYGPPIWSSQDSELERAIRMVTGRKVAK